MAVKRVRKETVVLPEPAPVMDTGFDVQKDKKNFLNKWTAGIILGVLMVVFFWYKTNSWPIVAVVGMRPITRFEVEQAMFKVNGKTQVDDIVTEILVKNELKKNKIQISPAEIEAKIAEIRKSLGTSSTLESILAQRGMSMDEFKKYLSVQMGIEKLLKDKITVTETEINSFISQNAAYMTAASGSAAQVTEATDAIKMSKLQTEVDKWLTDLKANNKVWKAPGV